MTDKELKDKTDRRGYITIKNGDLEAQILPESYRVYEERGWSVVESAGKKKTNRSPARTKSDPDKA